MIFKKQSKQLAEGVLKLEEQIKQLNERVFKLEDQILTKKKTLQSANWLKTNYSCPIPSDYYIETGNICNLECPFCSTGLRLKGVKRGFLKLEDYKIILERIEHYARNICLYNYGEPFLNKDILSMVSMTESKGILTSINSNLTVKAFDEKESEAIVRTGLSHLSASIDGASQETYSKYRIGGDIDVAINNLKQLQRAKVRLNSEKPHLCWGFLINKYNENEQDRAKHIASDIGVEIRFSLMDVWANKSWESTLHQKKYIPDVKNSDQPVKIENDHSLPIRVDSIKLHPNLFSWCIQPFNRMVVNWNGDVFPCCTVFEDRFAIGNILNTDIELLWNNNG